MEHISFYIFRHGETDFNRLRKYQGSLDIALNQTGVEQAMALAQNLKDLHLDHIVSSDLSRALRTAEIVLREQNCSLEQDKRLRESHMGEGEGASLDDLSGKYGEDFMARWRSPFANDYDIFMPGGEKKTEVLLRAMQALSEIALVAEKNQHSKIGISTHGGVVRLVCHAIAPELKQAISIANCCCYHIQYRSLSKSWKFIGSLNAKIDVI